MKQIIAYLKKHKLEEVTLALHKIQGMTGISVLEMRGCGRSRKVDSTKPFDDDSYDLLPRVKLEVTCKDQLVESVVSAIEQSAHTGLRGDGKIYILPINNAVRISTGERGEDAI